MVVNTGLWPSRLLGFYPLSILRGATFSINSRILQGLFFFLRTW